MFRTTRSLSFSLCALLLLGLAIAGCGGEKELTPVPVGELTEYRDPAIGFALKHPAGWIMDAQIGRVRMFNAPDVDKKFLDPAGAYPLGVTVTVDITRAADVGQALENFRSELKATDMQLGKEETVKAAGVDAVKIPYTANFGGGNILRGYHVLIPGDSALYDLGFAGFGAQYAAHAAVFEAILGSFTLPTPKEKAADETLPSDVFAAYDAGPFTMEYPDNFNFTNPPKGKNELVIGLRGVRLDCGIQVDVFGAQGLSVEKVFDQNKGKFPGASVGEARVGGEAARVLTYAATRDVERRIYFVVRNDKVFRITLDWYRPQREVYLRTYERVIGSFRFR
ncbi:MAG: hypothetical protein WB626_12415 [Bacteroidota bacterium]